MRIADWEAPADLDDLSGHLGGLGIVADRLLLNVAARGTARWLLERIAAVMRGEAS